MKTCFFYYCIDDKYLVWPIIFLSVLELQRFMFFSRWTLSDDAWHCLFSPCCIAFEAFDWNLSFILLLPDDRQCPFQFFLFYLTLLSDPVFSINDFHCRCNWLKLSFFQWQAWIMIHPLQFLVFTDHQFCACLLFRISEF